MKTLLSFATLSLLTIGSASSAELKIIDAKASLFWEHSGKFSENIVGAPTFENLPKGGGPDNETATAVLFDLTFAGDKNASPKYATATVDIIQSSRTGQQIVTHKAFTNFMFGADGVQHKTFMIEDATCMPMSVKIHAGKTDRTLKLDFTCK